MRVRTWLVPAGVSLLLGALVGCGNQSEGEQASGEPIAAESAAPDVLVTFYPARYLAERIGGELVHVELPLPEGEDPIFWKPDSDTIRRYQSADLVIINGAEFEKWAMTAPLARSRVLDSAEGFADEFIEFQSGASHSHGPAGEHSHTGIDGHTWLDPNNAIRQANAIADAFTGLDARHRMNFEINRDELTFDLLAIDRELRELTPRVSKARLLASHPAYNYLARRYAWTVTNLDLDPGTTLTEEDVDRVLQAAGAGSDDPIVLLWEDEPSTETVSLLAAAGVASVVFSPAENPTAEELRASGDYLAIMRANIERLAGVLPD